MFRAPPVALLALFASCTSVEWVEPLPDLPTGWRHYTLFVSDVAYVLARDESAATEVHAQITAAHTAMTEKIGGDPGRGLILALSFEDPLPIEDPEQYSRVLQDWRRRVIGFAGPMNIDIGSNMQIGANGKQVEVDPALPLHMLASPIARDDELLALPPTLVAATSFIALLPTESCLEATADAMIDLALEAEGISKFTYHAMTLIVGNPAAMMRDQLLEQSQATLTQTWMKALGLEVATDQRLGARGQE